MSGADWFLAGWLLFGALMVVAGVGKPKKPTEPRTAAVVVAIDLAIVAWLLWSHGVIA